MGKSKRKEPRLGAYLDENADICLTPVQTDKDKQNEADKASMQKHIQKQAELKAEVKASLPPKRSLHRTERQAEQDLSKAKKYGKAYEQLNAETKSAVEKKQHAEKLKEVHAELTSPLAILLREKVKVMTAFLKDLKKNDVKEIHKHIKDLETALSDFKKSKLKDKAAFNILSGECLLILSNAKKDMKNLKDPFLTRVYNAFISVISSFLNMLDRLQAYVFNRSTIDQPNRARFFSKKPAPVQETKDVLEKFETALKTMNKEVNDFVATRNSENQSTVSPK